MKKTIIATAVSVALGAPVAAQADVDVTVYGFVHQGIVFVNQDMGENKTDLQAIGSRFGIKASSDVGNGLTASAQYEFGTNTDDAADGVSSTRIATVGVSGGFGSVALGNQWGAYYNLVGVHVDPTFYTWAGGNSYYFGDSSTYGPARTPNTIKYANSFGPVSFELDVRMDDRRDGQGPSTGDGHAIAASIAANDNITFAAGVDNIEDGVEHQGAAVKLSFGNYWGSIAQHSADDAGTDLSTTQFWAGGSFGNTSAMIGTGRSDMGGDDATPGNDPSDVTLGVYHSLGGGLNLLYEGIKYDSDGIQKDKTTHLFGIRLDF